MRWHVTFTISMGKHGNQRVVIPFEGDVVALDEWLSLLPKKTDNAMVLDYATRKGFPVKNILLVEWSESK